MLLRPAAQRCAWPWGQAAQHQRAQLLCEPHGAPRGLGAGVCYDQTPSCYPSLEEDSRETGGPPRLSQPLPTQSNWPGWGKALAWVDHYLVRGVGTASSPRIVYGPRTLQRASSWCWAPPGSVAPSCKLNKGLQNVRVCFLTFRKETAASKP